MTGADGPRCCPLRPRGGDPSRAKRPQALGGGFGLGAIGQINALAGLGGRRLAA